jgi:gamma-glutamylcyclotransferase (GGCT)/AIG2-like uncharacterized protein YtfP
MTWLFAYGTLLPAQPRWHHLAPFVTDEGVDDAVPGTLFDTGQGYPAATFGGTSLILGRSFVLVDDRLDEALALLDEVEGAVAGLYRRVEVATAAGRTAFAYAFGGGLSLEPIEHGSWVAHLTARRSGRVSGS